MKVLSDPMEPKVLLEKLDKCMGIWWGQVPTLEDIQVGRIDLCFINTVFIDKKKSE